jgi:hypothetical protein
MKTIRESFTIIGLVGPAVWLWLMWDAIPAVVPVHYGANGVANGYAGKQALWVLVAVSVFLYLLLRIILRFVRAFNLPVKVGAALRPRMEAEVVEMIGWLRLEITWLFAFLIVSSARVAEKLAGGLGSWALVVPGLLIMSTVGIFLFRMSRLTRLSAR